MSSSEDSFDVQGRRGRLASIVCQVAMGTAVLGLAAYFLVMSNRTGLARYDTGQRLLTNIATASVALDSTLFPLLFELRTDLDVATAAQGALVDDVGAYAEFAGAEQAENLIATVSTKMRFVDNFKARQAVARNSRAIASEMISDLVERDAGLDAPRLAAVHATEREWLRFISLGQHAGAFDLERAIQATEAGNQSMAANEEWQSFRLHAQALQRNGEQLRELLLAVYSVPLEAVLEAESELLASEYHQAKTLAGKFRLALFVVAVLLLSFSGYKALQVSRYVSLVRHANERLEHRVHTRTAELSTANASLHAEMREREEMESQLRMAQKLESIGQLAAGIAHEINTPTQYVSDNVNFLETAWSDLGKVLDEYDRALLSGEVDAARSKAVRDTADVDYLREEVPRALHEAASGLKRIAHIVKAMKEFSHPGDESLQPTDLNRALRSTVEVARNEWKYVAELEFDLDPELPPVPCDLSSINQVILNIVVNAAQAIGGHLEPGELGRIRVSSRQLEEHIEVVIEDNGPGIPEELRSQVFDPFFTTKEVGKGTGQGLGIAFRVVQQQHGGTLTVGEGQDGRGARFVIKLPKSKAGSSESSAPAPALAMAQ